MTPHDLRQALRELRGQRTATFVLAGVDDDHAAVTVNNAMLVPEEDDKLVKLTDGHSIYIIDAERVAAVRLGQPESLAKRQ